MIAPDPKPGKFGIMALLFRLVGNLPKNQQLILLKQVEQKRIGGLMKFFNILIISALTFFCVSTLNAEIYTWTDEKGVKHYSDTPPENAENYEVHTESKTYKYDEEADQKRTEADQRQIQSLIQEDDENDKKKKLKAQEAEKNRPPTQEEKIAAEKDKLEEKISFLEEQPLEYFGNELNKHRYIEHYRSRLNTLLQNPNKYFNKPDTWQGNIKIPD